MSSPTRAPSLSAMVVEKQCPRVDMGLGTLPCRGAVDPRWTEREGPVRPYWGAERLLLLHNPTCP